MIMVGHDVSLKNTCGNANIDLDSASNFKVASECILQTLRVCVVMPASFKWLKVVPVAR